MGAQGKGEVVSASLIIGLTIPCQLWVGCGLGAGRIITKIAKQEDIKFAKNHPHKPRGPLPSRNWYTKGDALTIHKFYLIALATASAHGHQVNHFAKSNEYRALVDADYIYKPVKKRRKVQAPVSYGEVWPEGAIQQPTANAKPRARRRARPGRAAVPILAGPGDGGEAIAAPVDAIDIGSGGESGPDSSISSSSSSSSSVHSSVPPDEPDAVLPPPLPPPAAPPPPAGAPPAPPGAGAPPPAGAPAAAAVEPLMGWRRTRDYVEPFWLLSPRSESQSRHECEGMAAVVQNSSAQSARSRSMQQSP